MALLSAEELIGDNRNPVSLPAIVININRLLNEPGTSSADITNAIKQEPVLANRLLKLINSAFYNFPTKIDSLDKAVTILGTQQLRDLVIASTIISKFDFKPEIEFDLETFWCHCIATGLVARNIAASQYISYPEQFFVAGLLHDMGKIVMAMLLPGETESLNRINMKTSLNLQNTEEQIFGFTHEQLGSKLMENWHFPESIVQAVLHHHDLAAVDKFKKASAVLHIANITANNIQAPISKDDDTLLNEQALDILQIDQTVVESYHEGVYNTLDDVLQILYYDVIKK